MEKTAKGKIVRVQGGVFCTGAEVCPKNAANWLKTGLCALGVIFGGGGELFAASWKQGVERGLWEDAANWGGTDFITKGDQIWFTCNHPIHVDLNTDVEWHYWAFLNCPDLDVNLNGHTVHFSCFTPGAANGYTDPYPRIKFANGTIAQTNEVGELQPVELRLQAHHIPAQEAAEYRFESIYMPLVDFRYEQPAQPNVDVLFTNCVMGICDNPRTFEVNDWNVRFEDSLVSNALRTVGYNSKKHTEEDGWKPSRFEFVRSTYRGKTAVSWDVAEFYNTLIQDSTFEISGGGGFNFHSGLITNSTITVNCPANTHGFSIGNFFLPQTSEVVDSEITVTNASYALSMFWVTETRYYGNLTREAASNQTVILKNTTLRAIYDENKTDCYWSTGIGQVNAQPHQRAIDCTLRMENFKYVCEPVNQLGLSFWFNGLTNFTWQIVGGGSKFWLDSDYGGGNDWDAYGDSKIEFIVPKEGMAEPGFTFKFGKTWSLKASALPIKVRAEPWLAKTGGEVCLIKTYTMPAANNPLFENWIASAELPEAVHPNQIGKVKLETREGTDEHGAFKELWLTAPKAPNGLVILVK